MTGFKPRQGSTPSSPKRGKQPASLWKQSRRAFQRYLLISTGICSTALGLALIVSFVIATYGRGTTADVAYANGNVDVRQIQGRYTTSSLDSNQTFVAREQAPDTADFPVAPPAPPLDVEHRVPQTAEAPAAGEPSEALPPGAQLDSRPASPQLDPVAAALPVPLLAQDEAESAPEPPEEDQIAPPGPAVGQMPGVNVTFYDCLNQGFCGVMYNGQPVYEGAAACSWDLPLGTRFVIEGDPSGRIYVCADRGLLANTWVDIFFYNPNDGWAWQESVGRYATIRILSLPTFDPQS
jgi:hypothetical protein